MKNLLIDEPPILVSPTLATLIGLNEAIFLQQLNYWMNNPKNKGIEKDGYKWVYNSHQEWQEKNFPFWSVMTIRRIIANLENKKLVISIQLDSTDRKKLYRINFEAVELLTDRCNISNCTVPSVQNEQMLITETTTETNSLYTQSKDCVYSDTTEISTTETEESSVDKKKAPPKHKHGEYKNVLLTDVDLEKLKQKFPSTYEEKIQRLSEGKEMRGYKYKNDYLAILKWAERDGYEEDRESQPVSLSELEAYITPEGERRFRRKGAQ